MEDAGLLLSDTQLGTRFAYLWALVRYNSQSWEYSKDIPNAQNDVNLPMGTGRQKQAIRPRSGNEMGLFARQSAFPLAGSGQGHSVTLVLEPFWGGGGAGEYFLITRQASIA